MNRRGFLRSAVAGLLGCALPAGLLVGPVLAIRDAGPWLVTLPGGTVLQINAERDRVVTLASHDNGRTWEVEGGSAVVVSA